jgi:hypothetical protein
MMSLLSYEGLTSSAIALFWGGYAASQVGAVNSLLSGSPDAIDEKTSENFQKLQNELKISGKVHLLEKGHEISSSGSSLFSCFEKVLVIDKTLAEIDPDAMKWLMRRELNLLKNNSYVVLHGAALASTIASLILCPSPWNLSLGIASYIVVERLFETRIRRGQDKVALSEASEPELIGALRLFRACTRAESDFHRTKRRYTGGFFYKESSPSDRFEMVKNSLKERFKFSEQAIEVACADKRTESLRKYILFTLNELN